MTTRYLIIKETPCPACNGDGWRVVEESDLCPECDGLGVKLEEIAVLDSLEMIEVFLPDRIPFMGEPMPNKETDMKSYYGLGG